MIPLMAPMPAYRGQIAPVRTFPLWQIAALRVILVRISAQTWVSRGHKCHKHLPLCARCARRLPEMAAPSSLAPADDNYLASKKQPGLRRHAQQLLGCWCTRRRHAYYETLHGVNTLHSARRRRQGALWSRFPSPLNAVLHEIRCYDANI